MADILTRRSFVKGVGSVTVVPVALGAPQPGSPGKSTPHAAQAERTLSSGAATEVEEPLYLFFNAEEVAFIEAACERLIPADSTGPGALEAWVPNYLDKQLGGAWGTGERLYRSGPWQTGTPTQGYQLPFTPGELFHIALRAINARFAAKGSTFAEASSEAQDAYLKSRGGGGPGEGGGGGGGGGRRTHTSSRSRPAASIWAESLRRRSSTCC
jgi:gluconate 2-dehydrogenase gamma chain